MEADAVHPGDLDAHDVTFACPGWGLVVDAPLVGGVFCVWGLVWSGCSS